MGWSCTRMAGDRLRAISNACIAQTGSQNVFKVGEDTYFFETGRERPDGAITGQVWKNLPEEPGKPQMAKKSCSFRIEPDGSMNVGPKWMRTVPVLLLYVDDVNHGPWEAAVHGEPNEDNLAKYVMLHAKSFEPGGANFHISRAAGHVVYPKNAAILNLDTGELVAWKAGMFQVYS